MASNSDDNMTLDSRTPSRPSTPTPTANCIRYTEMTEEIRGLATAIQANVKTLSMECSDSEISTLMTNA
ncbi:hypothetical protein TNCV_4240691 [Trichonephila clavipes]|nr:hypothetical protein TNCV_4240691 [Trichonephila clavipes]